MGVIRVIPGGVIVVGQDQGPGGTRQYFRASVPFLSAVNQHFGRQSPI